MKLDKTIIAFVIGALVTLGGNYLNHLFIMKQDEAQWYRKMTAEEAARKREEHGREVERVRKIYGDSIRLLSKIIASKDADSESPGDDTVKLYAELFDSLSMLSLHQGRNPELERMIDYFRYRPRVYDDSLLAEIQKLAFADKVLFPNGQIPFEKEVTCKVQVNISDSFRRKIMVEKGIDLPQHYIVGIDIKKLSSSQRTKLWSTSSIPSQTLLSLPVFDEHTGKIELRKNPWEAELNPLTTSGERIVKIWEKFYDRAYQEAIKKQENAAK